jgi:predicted peroxiredoxin
MEEWKMSDEKKLVVVVTSGFNDERSSVAWSVANGAIGSNMQVTMFLVSSGVDWVRKGAAEQARLNPLDPPVKDMIQTVMDNGGKIMVQLQCSTWCSRVHQRSHSEPARRSDIHG